MTPANQFQKLKRRATNAFIAAIIVLFLIDGMPGLLRIHLLLQKKLDPFLKVTGLWQGPWDLFAPEPDKENVRVTAKVIYPDGSVFEWKSPEWKDKSRWYLMRNFRKQEYYDNVRRNGNQPTWPSLARHILRLAEEQQDNKEPPAQIAITRHWWNVPNPTNQFVRIANINEPMGSYQFYHQVFPREASAR